MPPLLSNYIRQKRFDEIKPFLKGHILDLGCGTAETIQYLQAGQLYMGVERNPEILKWLQENYPQHAFINRNLDRETLDLDRAFDTILMMAIIEHLDNPATILSQVPNYLRPAGRVVITTPSPVGGVIHTLGSRMGFFYKEASDEHKAFFSDKSLTPLIDQSGLEISHFKRFLFGGNQLFVCSLKQ